MLDNWANTSLGKQPSPEVFFLTSVDTRKSTNIPIQALLWLSFQFQQLTISGSWSPSRNINRNAPCSTSITACEIWGLFSHILWWGGRQIKRLQGHTICECFRDVCCMDLPFYVFLFCFTCLPSYKLTNTWFISQFSNINREEQSLQWPVVFFVKANSHA